MLEKSIVKTLVFIFLMTLMILSIGPLLWVLVSSFKSNSDILSSAWGFPSGVSHKNYVTAFEISPIARYFINSIVISALSTIFNLVIMSMAAYVIARVRFRGRTFFRLMFSTALLVPTAALLLPLYISVKAVGLYDSIWGLIIVYAGFGIPTTLFIMASYYLTIPKAMEESSSLDGAGFLRNFLQIIAPLAKPAYATAGVLVFLNSWKEFQFALTLTTGHNSRTLPLALFYFKSAFASDYGAMFAATAVVALPSILVFIVMQEQVVSGLTSGSVKG